MKRVEDTNLPTELRPVGTTEVSLSSKGEVAALPVCRPVFTPWDGPPADFDYGKKLMLKYENEPCFAELVILRLLLKREWDGVWVETYGGTHYLRSMPKGWTLKSEHVSIPEDKEELLRKIWKAGKTTACFDVFARRGDSVLFCEAKHAKKDKLTRAQLRFIEGALACGILPDSLLIAEWDEI